MSENRVAQITIARENFAIITDMLPIVTTETSGIIKMTDVIDMFFPAHFHLREIVALIDILYFFNRSSDRYLF